jgi:hypothetical protein
MLEGSRQLRTGGRGITRRSVILGLALAAGLCAITPYNDYIVGNTYLAGNHFPIGGVAVLLILSLLNFLRYRTRGRPFLSPPETAVIYIIIMVTSGIPSSGLLRYLVPCGTVPYYFAGMGNRWAELFWDRIPPWLAVSDPQAVIWFWEGLSAGALVPWRPWLVMMSHWLVLVGAFWVMMISLAVLVRKQWVDRERLTFPLVQFPLEVLRPGEGGPSGAFFTNRLVWIGAGVVFLVHLVNGLARQFPAIPRIPTWWDLNPYLVDRPWSAAYPLGIGVFFSAVGFAYLLSLDVAAGFWVSTLFIKLEGIILSALGYEGDSSWAGTIAGITRHEQMGGLFVLALVLLWLLRGTLADAFRRAFFRSKTVDDRGEPLGYDVAVYALLASTGAAFAWLVAAGMTPLFAALLLVFFLAVIIVLTRIAAEAGMLMIQLVYSPVDYLYALGGTSALGPANLTVLTFVNCSLMWDLREFLMPSILNAFRLAELSGVSTRKLVRAIPLALIVCTLIAIPVFLITFYKPGAAQTGSTVMLDGHPRQFFGELADRLENPGHAAPYQYVSMAAGGLLVAALSWLRLNFVWWPIHPLGFVMATSWASLNLWFSLFVGWFLKLLTIRYTGLRGYVGLRPLFIGIVVGDVLGAVLWIIVGWFTGSGFMVTVN